MKSNIVILIPARGGSKSFQDKNLAKINDETLLERTVRIAKESNYSKNIYVSSDSEKILGLAESSGAIAHKRNPSAATDSATANDVINEFLSTYDWLSADTWIMYLQPTSPLRTKEIISTCVNLAQESDLPVVTISEMKQHPMKSLRIDSGFIAPYFTNVSPSANRQDFQKAFVADGNVFLFKVKHFWDRNNFPIDGAMPVYSPINHGKDIDSQEDLLEVIEFLDKKSERQK